MKPLTYFGRLFKNAYSGISNEVWWLSIIMLINRSGSMVFPFLSIYLTHHLHFTALQTGWVLSAYGVGSMSGALLGGWLSDRFGNYVVQFGSLVLGGIGWLLLSFVTEYEMLLIFVIIQSTISESLRPANSSSITGFATGENLTRSYSLNRMAMNLGYTIGPALGGLFATISYTWLFVADGFTCILAGIAFAYLFRSYFSLNFKKPVIKKEIKEEEVINSNPLRDLPFVGFILCVILFACVFFQLLFTLPIYYKDIHHLTEFNVGTLLAINGLFIFFSEMVFVYTVGARVKKEYLIIAGVVFVGLSFIMLNWSQGFAWFALGMIVISFGEILSMPFMQTFVAARSNKKNLGRYMAYYSFAYSAALILSPLIGMRVIQHYGFHTLWNICLIVSIITAVGLALIFRAESKMIPAGAIHV